MRVGVDHHLRGDHDDAQMTIEEEHLEEITEEEQNKRRKSKCNVANAILHAFEEQSNTNAGAFFSFMAGPGGLVESSNASSLSALNFSLKRKKMWAMFFDGYFGRLWTMSLAITIVCFPSMPWLLVRSTEEEEDAGYSSFETVCAAASVLNLVSLVDCW